MGTGGGPRDDLRRLPHGDALPLTRSGTRPSAVWYAGYGSNLCAEGFRCYLEGGTRPGASGACRGARDATPPRADRPCAIPHRLYFAGHSTTWGGAPCFVDLPHTPATPARGRAYLITWEQFEDVVAQENGRATTAPIDLGLHHDDLAAGWSRRLGAGRGRYDNVLCVGRLSGLPILTITSPWTMGEIEVATVGAPSPAYLRMIVDGLREAHELSDDALVAYLGSAPGCSEERVRGVLA